MWHTWSHFSLDFFWFNMCLSAVSYLRACNPRLAILQVLPWLPLPVTSGHDKAAGSRVYAFMQMFSNHRERSASFVSTRVWYSWPSVGNLVIYGQYVCDPPYMECFLQCQPLPNEQLSHLGQLGLKTPIHFSLCFVSFFNLFSISNLICSPSFLDSAWFSPWRKKRKIPFFL